MPYLESKILHQKICEQIGAKVVEGSQWGYFSRDLMSRLIVYLEMQNEQITKLKQLVGGENGSKA